MLPSFKQRLEILASFSELLEKDPRVYSYKCLIVVDGYIQTPKNSQHSYLIIRNAIDVFVRKNEGSFCMSFPPSLCVDVCVLLFLCLKCVLVVNCAQNALIKNCLSQRTNLTTTTLPLAEPVTVLHDHKEGA